MDVLVTIGPGGSENDRRRVCGRRRGCGGMIHIDLIEERLGFIWAELRIVARLGVQESDLRDIRDQLNALEAKLRERKATGAA